MVEGNFLQRRPGEELGLNAPLPDFFERLAAQRRRSVQRHEGPTTGIGGEIPFLARHIRDQLLSGPRAMGRVARGELDPTSSEGVAAGMNAAMMTVGARAPFAKAGELGVGGGKLGASEAPPAASSPISATKPPMKAQALTSVEQGDMDAIWEALSGAKKEALPPKDYGEEAPKLPKARADVPTVEELAARRASSPFQTLAYRGLKSPLERPELASKGYNETYLAAHPEVADLYAGVPPELAARRDLKPQPWQNPREGSNVLPVLLDTSNYHTVDAGGMRWEGMDYPNGSTVMQKAIEHAKKNGHSGVIVKNIHDEPAGDTAHLPPTDVYIPLDNRGRLPWADFDPAKWHLKDLLAGFGGIAVPAGVAGKVLQRPDGVHHFLQDTEDDAGAFSGVPK